MLMSFLIIFLLPVLLKRYLITVTAVNLCCSDAFYKNQTRPYDNMQTGTEALRSC